MKLLIISFSLLFAYTTRLYGVSVEGFSIHPFKDNWRLVEHEHVQPEKLKEWVENLFYNNGLVTVIENNDSNFIETTFAFQNIPLCISGVKVKTNGKGFPIVFGEVPQVDTFPNHVEWFDLRTKKYPFIAESESTKCWLPKNKTLVPAYLWKRANWDGRYFRIIVDEDSEIYKEPLFFEAMASVHAYTSGPADGEIKEYNIALLETGYLESEFFKTETGKFARAFKEDFRFHYLPTQVEFQETSVFAHAEEIRGFFSSHGWEWTEKKPMTLQIHATLQNSRNNGLYEPETSSSNPKISLGDGDGVRLANLPLDADVIFHEFSHHIIYRSLKAGTDESIILHEGLADAFTFLKTGNACLGESICPNNAFSVCQIVNQCLRTGENSFVIGSQEYTDMGSQNHLKGQVISAIVWELRSILDDDALTKTLLKSIEYLYRNSGLKDWVISMMVADQDLNQGQNVCAIYDKALEKGFGELLQGVQCQNSDMWPRLNGQEGSEGIKDKDKSKNPISCGTTLPLPFTLLWWFFPIMVIRSRSNFK